MNRVTDLRHTVVVLLLLPLLASCARVVDDRDEGAYVALVNETRAAAGLKPLAVESGLTGYVRGHAARMADRGQLFHSQRVEALARSGGWGRLGENVGTGTSVARLHEAFMRSSEHRANILGDYTHVAVGATRSGDGRLYLTAVFVHKVDRTVLSAQHGIGVRPDRDVTA